MTKRNLKIFLFGIFFIFFTQQNIQAQTNKDDDFVEKCKNGEIEECRKAIEAIDESLEPDLNEKLLNIINNKGNEYYQSSLLNNRDLKKSVEFFELSCQNDDIKGCTALLYFSEKGLLNPDVLFEIEETLIHINNPKKLLEDYKKLCKKEDGGVACNNVGVLLLRNAKRGDEQEGIAFNYLEDSCSQGSAWGCYNLAFLTLRTLPTDNRENRESAENYFRLACISGLKEACLSLEEFYNFKIEANSEGIIQELLKLTSAILLAEAGCTGGAEVGSVVGANIGSVASPAGSAVGASIGGTVGCIAGGVGGDIISDSIISSLSNKIPNWEESNERKFRELIPTEKQKNLPTIKQNGQPYKICLTHIEWLDKCYNISKEDYLKYIDQSFQYRTVPIEITPLSQTDEEDIESEFSD